MFVIRRWTWFWSWIGCVPSPCAWTWAECIPSPCLWVCFGCGYSFCRIWSLLLTHLDLGWISIPGTWMRRDWRVIRIRFSPFSKSRRLRKEISYRSNPCFSDMAWLLSFWFPSSLLVFSSDVLSDWVRLFDVFWTFPKLCDFAPCVHVWKVSVWTSQYKSPPNALIIKHTFFRPRFLSGAGAFSITMSFSETGSFIFSAIIDRSSTWHVKTKFGFYQLLFNWQCAVLLIRRVTESEYPYKKQQKHRNESWAVIEQLTS